MPLTAADKIRMAATVTEHLPDTCDIYRLTETDDGMGGTTTPTIAESSPNVDDVAFLLSPNRTEQGEAARSGSVWADSEWVGTLPAGTDVEASDVIVHSGAEYEVTRHTGHRSNELQVKVGLVKRGES